MKYFPSIVNNEYFFIQQPAPHFVCKLICFNSPEEITDMHKKISVNAYSYPIPGYNILVVCLGKLAIFKNDHFFYERNNLKGEELDSFLALANSIKSSFFNENAHLFKNYKTA